MATKFYIVVDYFDSFVAMNELHHEYLGIAYDSLDGESISAMFKPAGFIKLYGDNAWKVAVFSLQDGLFMKRGNAADFRVCLRSVNFETKTELVVRRVAAIVME